jgi:hypothetical protein
MTAPISRPTWHLGPASRRYWLPDNGYGNGLDDHAWAPILDVDARIVAPLLEALRAAGVPAYAAPERLTALRRIRPDDMWPAYRLWVGTSAHGTAEDTLMAVLPRLLRELPDDRRSGHDLPASLRPVRLAGPRVQDESGTGR